MPFKTLSPKCWSCIRYRQWTVKPVASEVGLYQAQAQGILRPSQEKPASLQLAQ